MNATLAIDCAFPQALLALRVGDSLAMRSFGPQRSHALRLLGELELLLTELEVSAKDLGRIGVGQGPGSFTGLRVALATASGLAEATGANLVGFATFDALPIASAPTLYAFDARQGMVYCGLRQGEEWLEPALPRSIDEAQALLKPRAKKFFGTASERYPELAQDLDLLSLPPHADAQRALDLTELARHDKPVLPTYKEGAQAQRLFGTPVLGRPLDGDEI
jgi:tRNA threonylcarbamoyl adenosine modification protein YeaZ